MSIEAKLEGVVSRYEEIRARMTDPDLDPRQFQKFAKEFSDLEPIVAAIRELMRLRAELGDLGALVADTGGDAEMRAMAESEFYALKARLPDLERELQIMLLPKDAADEKNAILEVRAGTGGEEAALFAAELFRMYQRYAAIHGWRFDMMEYAETGLGGLKEGIANISGRGVFARLKYESGVHRVQRVPATEGSGRIHTSAATVAVLPEAEEVDIRIEDKDLRIDVFRAQGAGGQHVNTTDSAVRVTHLPTGLAVAQQEEKSQHKNKAKALKILRARLYELERGRQDAARAADRKSQVGSGDRSERIRTYNFPQNRLTDHRINLSLYKLEQVVTGEALDEVIDALTTEDRAARLAEMPT